jgi:hypothetical protein
MVFHDTRRAKIIETTVNCEFSLHVKILDKLYLFEKDSSDPKETCYCTLALIEKKKEKNKPNKIPKIKQNKTK